MFLMNFILAILGVIFACLLINIVEYIIIAEKQNSGNKIKKKLKKKEIKLIQKLILRTCKDYNLKMDIKQLPMIKIHIIADNFSKDMEYSEDFKKHLLLHIDLEIKMPYKESIYIYKKFKSYRENKMFMVALFMEYFNVKTYEAKERLLQIEEIKYG